MIKAEVEVSNDEICINGFLINIIGHDGGVSFIVNRDVKFDYLEQAIKYCMEN